MAEVSGWPPDCRKIGPMFESNTCTPEEGVILCCATAMRGNGNTPKKKRFQLGVRKVNINNPPPPCSKMYSRKGASKEHFTNRQRRCPQNLTIIKRV